MSYPLQYYNGVTDKLRHWITTLKEGAEFTIAEANEAVGHPIGRQLAYLSNRTEVSRARRGVYKSFGPGYVEDWWGTTDRLFRSMKQAKIKFEYEKHEF